MIHTVGEQIQGNTTRTLEMGGRGSAKKKGGGGGGGGVGKLDSTSSLRLDKDPRWAREVGNVRLCSCRSSVSWRVIHVPRACAVLGCWRQGVAWQQSPARCLLPCIRALREKENFQLFHFVQRLKMVHYSISLNLCKCLWQSLLGGFAINLQFIPGQFDTHFLRDLFFKFCTQV